MAGLILAGFIGGAIRTLLSSEQIQNRILTEVQNALPALQVKMESAHVQLARGIWPGLSIYIPKLHLVKPEACGETYGTLDLENMELPLDLWSLIRNRVKWDVVSVEHLNLTYDRKPCPGGGGAAPSVPEKSPEAELKSLTDSADKVRETMGQAFVAAQNLEKYIRGVRIKGLDIGAADDPSWRISVSDLYFHTGRRLTTSAKIHFEKALGLGHIVHEAFFSAQADSDELTWDLRSPLKEGSITWTGVANHVHDQLDQKVTIRQVPLKDVLSEVQTWAGLPRGGSPRFIWLSCDLVQSGALSQFKQIPMQISDFKIDGEGEQIRAVSGQQVWPWERTPLHQPLRFQVNRLSLQTLFDLLAKEGLPAIIPKPGQWTGELQFSNPRTWSMDGVLEGTEVLFSNQSVRGRQTILRMKTLIQSESDRVKAELSNVLLADGTAKGKILFHFDGTLKTGDIDVDLSSFSLSPSIQNLMLNGTASPMKINGHGRIERGDWQSWKGTAEWKVSEGRGWKVFQPKVDTGYTDGLFTVNAHVREAQIDSGFTFYDQIKSVLGDTPSPWHFTDGAATAVIGKTGGEVKSFHLRGPQNHTYHFRGSWDRGGELAGFVDFSSAKKWKVRGWDGRLVVDGLQ